LDTEYHLVYQIKKFRGGLSN